MAGICHCKNCQKQSGSAYSILFAVPETTVTVTGQLTTYVDHGDSGNAVNRQFCGTCGSPVFSIVPTVPGLTFIKAGTLDDTSGFKPGVHFWTDSAQNWVEIPAELPQMPRNP